MTVQLMTLRKRTSRNGSESDKNSGISFFKARGSILREIKDTVSFTIINLFLTLAVYPIFQSYFITSRSSTARSESKIRPLHRAEGLGKPWGLVVISMGPECLHWFPSPAWLPPAVLLR